MVHTNIMVNTVLIKTVDNLGTGATLWLGILSLLLTIVWIYLLFHHLRRTTDNPTCKE